MRIESYIKSDEFLWNFTLGHRWFQWRRVNLTRCGLVTPHGVRDFGQHWFGKWLVARPITCTNNGIIHRVLLPDGEFTGNARHTSHWYEFEHEYFKITAASPQGPMILIRDEQRPSVKCRITHLQAADWWHIDAHHHHHHHRHTRTHPQIHTAMQYSWVIDTYQLPITVSDLTLLEFVIQIRLMNLIVASANSRSPPIHCLKIYDAIWRHQDKTILKSNLNIHGNIRPARSWEFSTCFNWWYHKHLLRDRVYANDFQKPINL